MINGSKFDGTYSRVFGAFQHTNTVGKNQFLKYSDNDKYQSYNFLVEVCLRVVPVPLK